MCLTIAEAERWSRRLESTIASPIGHAAAVDADEQLGERPGEKWRDWPNYTVLAPNNVGPFRWTKTSSKDINGPMDPWWECGQIRSSCGHTTGNSHTAGASGGNYDAGDSVSE